MQSRWDPDTHPSLTLSCSALWTLHLDIFVYSFENILALMDGAFKYIDRNIFERGFGYVLRMEDELRKKNSSHSAVVINAVCGLAY